MEYMRGRQRLKRKLTYCWIIIGRRLQVAIGFLLGVVVLATAFNFYRLLTTESAQQIFWRASRSMSVFNLIYNYQTLIGGFIAVAGAVLTIRRMQAQIDQEAKLHKQQRKRKLRAARAMLPLILTSFTEYARQCGKAVCPLLDVVDEHEAIPHEAIVERKPKLDIVFPRDIVSEIKEVIEHENPKNVVILTELVAMSQILQSRFEGLRDSPRHRITSRSNVNSLILDCAELEARASALYEYARSNGRSTPGDFTQYIKGALWSVIEGNIALDVLIESAEHRIRTGFYIDRFSPR